MARQMRIGIKMSRMTGTARPVTLRSVLPKDKQVTQ
jgi:hypothetical protein